ncbi:hypothetical protein Bhyg_05496 [Pseudolycoriella hygida]|uniref:Uncharacterized protein n=1 Tax=Pseudolycoriella hygida TaxID=35572 RepID=A0A9Q0MYT1_9DIPT|nr:hypothetical protein Bhyg_05496 [Pseudolycoriella hygida]
MAMYEQKETDDVDDCGLDRFAGVMKSLSSLSESFSKFFDVDFFAADDVDVLIVSQALRADDVDGCGVDRFAGVTKLELDTRLTMGAAEPTFAFGRRTRKMEQLTNRSHIKMVTDPALNQAILTTSHSCRSPSGAAAKQLPIERHQLES